jgi:hypothetical protein
LLTKEVPVFRRAIAFTFLASFAAGSALTGMAQAQPVTSESLQPPPGDNGDYNAPPPDRSYGAPAPAQADETDPEDNPYADPAAGGAYDPSAQSPRQYPSPSAPAPAPGPRGAAPYGYGNNAPAQPYAPAQPSAPAAPPRGAAPYGYTTAPAQPGGPQGHAPEATVGSSCDDLFAQLQRYYGPPENPMQPRDEACAATRSGAEAGRPNPAFRQCSDDFFKGYEAKRSQYRACMDQDASKGQERLEQRSATVEAARSGYGGTAPQAAGRFARAGSPGWLGVQIQPVSPQSAYRLGVEGMAGAYVISAVMGSPAQKAGLQRGDIIVGFDGQPIVQPKDLQYQAERLVAGQSVKLEVLRGGQRQFITVEITQRP